MKRSKALILRLNEEEMAMLNECVHKSGRSRESYLRALIQGNPIRERPPMDLVNVLRSLQHISNNLNQIATKAHSMGFVDTEEYWKNVNWLQEEMRNLWEAIS